MPSTAAEPERHGEGRTGPFVRIAVGVLRRADGAVLIAQRPPGKEAAGWWEFPGGKLEAGESVRQALLRELAEELGVRVRSARRLMRLRHGYSLKAVELDTWLVSDWEGEPAPREGQALAWCRLGELGDYRLLPADGPILAALRLPPVYLITPPALPPESLLARLADLPPDALLRLRLPSLTPAAYRALAEQVVRRRAGSTVLLDREAALSVALGCGWHASEAVLHGLHERPVPDANLMLASCHDAAGLARARACGADAALLGTVQASANHPATVPLGWQRFAALSADAGLPVYAIGGLAPADLPAAWEAGAQGVAGISAWFG